MSDRTLSDWLTYLEGLHPQEIDLGLDRVAAVAAALDVERPAGPVITVGGTNGKGSVCALIEAIVAATGFRVGLYTSPHLFRFNERIRIGGVEADDASICAALERVEAARGATSLTYFEFGTLAAFDLFARQGCDVWVLEVGLGGRLDATNVVAADVAVVVSVGIDHVDWLGGDRDSVGREKAGIARAGRPLVVGDPEPPAGLTRAAAEIGAALVRIGEHFDARAAGDRWDWLGPQAAWSGLPLPALAGGYQVRNAAVALAALHWAGLACERGPIERALREVRVPGRFEVRGGPIETILDVAHNPAAAAALARSLLERPCAGRTLAVIGMYRDKDAGGVLDQLAAQVDAWYVASLPGPRGRSAQALAEVVTQRGLTLAALAQGPPEAWRRARAGAAPGDRIVALGSFATVASVGGECL